MSTSELDRPGTHLPPISQVAMAVIAVVVTGGIYLAAYLPRQAPLGGAFACCWPWPPRCSSGHCLAGQDPELRVEHVLPGEQVGAAGLRTDRRDARVRLRLRPHPRVDTARAHADARHLRREHPHVSGFSVAHISRWAQPTKATPVDVPAAPGSRRRRRLLEGGRTRTPAPSRAEPGG